jgi:uncharacterized protein YccT (UPF0319 family)
MTEQTQPEVQQEQPAAEQSTAPELTIVDLQNIKAVLDVSARRGTFSAAEMEAVGATYNKLAKFLDAVVPAQETAQPAA